MEEHATYWPPFSSEAMATTFDGDSLPAAVASQSYTSQSQDPSWKEFLASMNTADLSKASNDCSNLENFEESSLSARYGSMSGLAYADPNTVADNSSTPTMYEAPAAVPPHLQSWQHFNTPATGSPPFHHNLQDWTAGRSRIQQMRYGSSGNAGLGIYLSRTSHPPENFQNTSYGSTMGMSPGFVQDNEVTQDPRNLWNHHDLDMNSQDGTVVDEYDEDDDGGSAADPCYAQLLYKCLKEAPNHTLSLRELYDWVTNHSQKAKDPNNRGWQNSVRHNLSMNAAFQRVSHGSGHAAKLKGSLWRLTDEAVRDGVISTTRYRKDPKRKSQRRGTPALSRQRSGAKGGQATRNATRRREVLLHNHQQNFAAAQQNFDPRNFQYSSPLDSPYFVHSAQPSPQPSMLPKYTAASPYFIDPSSINQMAPALPSSAPQSPPSQLQLIYDDTAKQGAFSSYQFLPIDYSSNPIFGDHDPDMNPETPSLMTEASYANEEAMPSLIPDCPLTNSASYSSLDTLIEN